jgi:hypothetical protein
VSERLVQTSSIENDPTETLAANFAAMHNSVFPSSSAETAHKAP